MNELILSIDQGTTSTRALLFDRTGAICALAQREFAQHFPRDGWVEHDAQEIWQVTQEVCREALAAVDSKAVIGIAITNQRETLVVWERATGKPVHNAIVWQDRRTADMCEAMRDAHEKTFTEKTGLLLDPYFSVTKLAWLLDNVSGVRSRAEKGELAFGSIDSWLLWNLTEGKIHATDITNAARTGLFNIHTQTWDDDLLNLFNIPDALLPTVEENATTFGVCEIFGTPLPILAMAGDQQAAAIGQACFSPAMIKSTYGTGCFVLAHTGERPLVSQNRLLTTIAYRINGEIAYALEGSIFMAGAIVQWLRDGLQIIEKASDSEALARSASDTAPEICIPAFVGLGAPHWDPHARAAFLNITRATSRADIVRAALESISHQTADLLSALAEDMEEMQAPRLRVDGGMVANDWLCQNIADITDCSIERPRVIETTASGVAMLAFLQAGVFKSLEEIAKTQKPEKQFSPQKSAGWRAEKRAGWQSALQRVLTN